LTHPAISICSAARGFLSHEFKVSIESIRIRRNAMLIRHQKVVGTHEL
jgi:hypothetical protein